MYLYDKNHIISSILGVEFDACLMKRSGDGYVLLSKYNRKKHKLARY